MTRDAELKARDFVALVVGGVQAESEVGVAQRLLMQAQTALGSYADPEWACSQGWPQFADRLLDLARGAEPGLRPPAGVPQRAVRIGAGAASRRGAGGVAGHRSRRAGTARPGRRHRSALAHRHRAGRQRPDRRRRHRHTVHRRRGCSATRPPPGRRHAAPASAARPQLAVKEQAWRQVIEDDTLPNITARAIVTGSPAPGQQALLQPVHRQVLRRDPRRVGAPVERGGADRRHRAVPVVGHQRRRACRPPSGSWSDPQLPPALRRLVLEGRAGVERALRARRFDVS